MGSEKKVCPKIRGWVWIDGRKVLFMIEVRHFEHEDMRDDWPHA